MKITYIAKSFIPSRTANSIHVMNICSALAELGHQVTLLLPDDIAYRTKSSPFIEYGLAETFKIKKLYYPSFKGKTIFYSLAIYKELKKHRPDLVIGRFVNGCSISSILNIPTVFDTHGPVWDDSRISVEFFKRMLKGKGLKRITTNSSALRDIYIKSDIFKNTRFNTRNLIVANNGARPYPLLDTIPALMNLKGALTVGYFGHLYSGRGIDIIIELAGLHPNIDFVIAGGEESDISYWKSVTKMENIHFLGYIKFGEVYKYRNSCDVLLAPYQQIVSPGGENADQGAYMNPIKLLEYMSSKKVIIASDLPSTREILTNQEDAILVRYDDVKEWSAALVSVFSNRDLNNKLSENAYRSFLSHYTWKIRALKMIENL